MGHMADLCEMLADAGIVATHTWEDYPSEELRFRSFQLFGLHDGSEVPWRNQLVVEDPRAKVSIIYQYGSFGCQEGLLEAWDFNGEPEGWLTAKEAYEYVKKRFEVV